MLAGLKRLPGSSARLHCGRSGLIRGAIKPESVPVPLYRIAVRATANPLIARVMHVILN
jgi:hypothetical protein